MKLYIQLELEIKYLKWNSDFNFMYTMKCQKSWDKQYANIQMTVVLRKKYTKGQCIVSHLYSSDPCEIFLT